MAVFPGAPPNPLGLKVELNLAGVWTDITKYVMQRDMVQITNMGRVDESSTIQASQLTLTLKNADGRFTPKNASGAYYPNIVRNTLIRVSVNATSQPPASVAYSGFRYYGEVSSWPPTSDISQRDVYAQIVASGIWRRISQAQTTIGSAYSRWVSQLTGTSVPATSWTMEDGSGALAFTTQIGAGGAATWTGTPSLSSDNTSFPGSDALPQFNNANVTAPVSSGATATDNVTRYALSVPAKGDSNAGGGNWNISETDSSGTVAKLEVYLLGAGQLEIEGRNSGGSLLFSGITSHNVQGVPLLVSAELTPSGGNINWALNIIKPGAAAVLETLSGSISGSIGAVTKVVLNRSRALSNTTFGQLGVFYAVPSIVSAAGAINGWAGEFAVVRFQRLCTEFGITSEVIGSTSPAMGPQIDDTLANIFQVIENTDGGLLYESIDQFGLGYRTLLSMQNQSVVVTLNYAAGVLGAPLASTYDDQLLKNQWLVQNWDGYNALATLTSGSLSIQPVPNGAGLYAGGPLQVSANAHSQVNAVAQQRLFQGTVDDVRYPQVTVDARRGPSASLFASVPGLRPGDYIQVTNLPAFDGGGTAKQLVVGWTETMNAFNWTQVFNTIPELPYESTFSPGVYSVVQATSGSTAFGSQVGSSVSGSQLGAGSVGAETVATTLSARTIGGMTSFVSASTPYDWSFAVSGTPADGTYFICTANQALPIAIGDTFTNSGGLGGPFTVATMDPPSGGNVNVYFTPTASSVMSTGTVYGGKNGDTWVNTSGGNQVNIWAAGAWTPIQWNANSVLSAATITAGLLVAGIVVAGIVNATTVEAAQYIATNVQGQFLAYGGTPALGNLLTAIAGAAGSDSFTNAFPQGLFSQQLTLQNQASAPTPFSGASIFFSSTEGRPRYVSALGEDSIMDRGSVSISQINIGNVTSGTRISANATFYGNPSAAQTMVEIEISGGMHTGASTFTGCVYQLFVDGSTFGNPVEFTGLNLNSWFDYTIRARLGIISSGSGGTAVVTMEGNLGKESVVIGGGSGQFVCGGATKTASLDSTINHTVAIYGAFLGSDSAQQMVTYITRITYHV